MGWSGTNTFMYLLTAGTVDSLGSLLEVPLYMKMLPGRPPLFPRLTCSPIRIGMPAGGGGVSAEAPLPDAMNKLTARFGSAGSRYDSTDGKPKPTAAGESSLSMMSRVE